MQIKPPDIFGARGFQLVVERRSARGCWVLGLKVERLIAEGMGTMALCSRRVIWAFVNIFFAFFGKKHLEHDLNEIPE